MLLQNLREIILDDFVKKNKKTLESSDDEDFVQQNIKKKAKKNL